MNRYRPLLLLLASVCGASYLFIEVAVDGGLEPAPLMCLPAATAEAVLLGYVVRTIGAGRAMSEPRGSWTQWLVIG